MSTTHFSGAVDSVGGFSVNGTSVIASTGTVTSPTAIVVGTTTISEAEIGVLDAVTAGTAAASKAVVLDSSKGIATITSATITTMTGNVTGNLTGYRVGAVNAAQSTISAAAGASNVSTVTVQLKDGAGTNLTQSKQIKVYKSSAADGLTLGAAASTGWSVASGGLLLMNGGAVTTSAIAMTSATGGCVFSLTDTNKAAEYLVLVTDDGTKISTVLTSASYGA
jgi:hypothetical protein